MTNLELIDKATNIAQNYKTKYMWGTFGSIITESLIWQKTRQYPQRYSTNRQTELRNEIGKNCWAFDCVGLIKSILWGWTGDTSKTYGGASYGSNKVPDTTASGVINSCTSVSTNFDTIEKGEAVYMEGHIGIYIGNGNVAEATIHDKYDGCTILPLKGRGWTKHGKMPWVEYVKEVVPEPTPIPPTKKTNEEIAKEVLNGKWGNGSVRKEALTKAGYDYGTVQKIVNQLVSGSSAGIKPAEIIKKGSIVKVKQGAKIYGKTSTFASFVYNDTWIVSQITGDRVVIDKNKNGTSSICSPININDLILA